MTRNDDGSAFREAMRGVKPLAAKERAALERRKRAARRRSTGAGANAAPQAAVDRRVLRDLARGRLRVEAEADLHGLTGAHALRVLEEFIAEAIAERFTCVRVVHGKGKRSGPGGPVLQALVHRWLATRADVLAFAPALPRDGGSGAVYVLLKR